MQRAGSRPAELSRAHSSSSGPFAPPCWEQSRRCAKMPAIQGESGQNSSYRSHHSGNGKNLEPGSILSASPLKRPATGTYSLSVLESSERDNLVNLCLKDAVTGTIPSGHTSDHWCPCQNYFISENEVLVPGCSESTIFLGCFLSIQSTRQRLWNMAHMQQPHGGLLGNYLQRIFWKSHPTLYSFRTVRPNIIT